MNEHDRYQELVAPFLLGALDADERADFEAHLPTCASCREEVELLRVGAEALPAGVPQLEVPPGLRERVMEVVDREAALLEAAGPEADRAAVAGPRREPWWRRLRVAVPLAAAAAAAVIAVVMIGGDGSARTLEAAQAPKGAAVRMHVAEEHSTLIAERLPAPPHGRVYQVWVKRGGADPQPTRALFSPSEAGTVSVDLPWSMEGVDAVMVTDEPMGGSESPTGKTVIVFDAA